MKKSCDTPSLEDIRPNAEDFDQQYAAKHFLGKSVDEAYEMFCENEIYYIGDFFHMGEKAFIYYLPVLNQALNDDKIDKGFLLSAIISILSLRQEIFWNHVEAMDQFINDFRASERAIAIGAGDPVKAQLLFEETGKAIEKYLIRREKRTDPFEFRL